MTLSHSHSRSLALRCSLFILSSKNTPLSLLSNRTYSSSLNNNNKNIPQSTMDNLSKDAEEAKKDQEREVCCKGACEYRPSKSVSDAILPHILKLFAHPCIVVLDDIDGQYGSCATPQDFEIYAPDASFEDPLMCAHGILQIKSAFYSLSKIFSESRIVEYSITENLISHGKKEILIDNKQYYKIMGKEIDMISLIKLHVEEGKVVRHEDWWDKKPLLNRDTAKLPLVGRIVEMSRRGSMLVTHAMMRFGKDPTV